MSGDNVQTWDDAILLPWREAFEMSTPAKVVPVTARRRRADIRSLADVVAAIALERAA